MHKELTYLRFVFFKEKWLYFADNYAFNETNKKKSQTKGSHSKPYGGGPKSKQRVHWLLSSFARSTGTKTVKNMKKAFI